MIEGYREGLDHLSGDYIWPVEEGSSFSIKEVKAGGEGEAKFKASKPTIVIKAKDQSPVVWALKNRKCAEAAMISVEAEYCHLHLLEMKSKLTQSELAKAVLQLEGMYLSALAVSKIIGIDQIASVTCYIGYKENALSPKASADMIMFKTFVGMENPIGAVDEWEEKEIDLPFGMKSSVKAEKRDLNGDVDFGAI